MMEEEFKLEAIQKAKGQLIRINELSQLTTLSKSCINLWVSQGKFPAPLALSATIKVWFLQEILDWLESQRGKNEL